MLFLLLLLNFDPFCSCMLSAHAPLLWMMTRAHWALRVCLLLLFAVLAHWALFLFLLLLGPFQPLVHAVTYKSHIAFPFHLLLGFPVVGPFLSKTGLNIYIYIYGWFQVRFDVTLSNVTQSNNLLKNLYFENFTVRLHVLYVVKMQAKIHSNRMLFTIRSIYSSFIHYFF